MAIETVPDTDLTYYLISFDAEGKERQDDHQGLMSQLTLAALDQASVTDVFILAHGWKGDVPAAKAQYGAWIGAMAQCQEDIRRLRESRPDFQPLLIGLHWPSLPWGDEKLSSGATSFSPEAARPIHILVEEYAERIADTARAREALKTIFEAARTNMNPFELPEEVKQAYEIINQEAALGAEGVGGAPGSDRMAFDPEGAYEAAMAEQEISFGGRDLGGLLSPLRQISFWKMKDRARQFGETGAHEFLKQVQERTAPPRRVRIHLMGHSFGCIVVSAMIAGPAGKGQLPRPVDSVALVQGAFSLWSYCAQIPSAAHGTPGYFNSIVAEGKVKGPIITTQSKRDTAVGRFYPLGAGIRGDVDFALGNYPKFGGVGAFGVRGLESGVSDLKMLAAEGVYGFEPGKLYNLESTDFINQGGGASGAHNDIAKPEVAHAVWEAVRAVD
ncbi:MAG: hypothetical protein V7641_2684 [Blastocatellia bacterium]